jgi:hypothetical protein
MLTFYAEEETTFPFSLNLHLILLAPYGIREGSRKLAKAIDPQAEVNQEIDGQVIILINTRLYVQYYVMQPEFIECTAWFLRSYFLLCAGSSYRLRKFVFFLMQYTIYWSLLLNFLYHMAVWCFGFPPINPRTY